MLMLFNTLGRKLEAFKPIDKTEIRMYTCGPTVYDFPHIGNYRAFVFADLLKRYLMFKGYKVKHVTNITDVDDKTIARSQQEGKTLKELTRFYEKAFLEDLRALNCLYADIYPRATEHIDEMVRLIQILIDKGYAYLAEDGSIYYNVSKFKDYGKLSGIKKDQLKPGARVNQQEYSKEQAADFALWKAYSDSDGPIFWEPEFKINGKIVKLKGRPGWHIECSAMSMKYLGEHFDIHTGGIDLIFPHHENEIAQSEAATGKKFVNYWVHNEFLLVEGKKMSKSLGNFYTLRDLLDKHKPEAIRYVLISTHYRQLLNFTLNSVKAAEKTLQRIALFLYRLKQIKSDTGDDKVVDELLHKVKEEFKQHMDNDLNVTKALAAIFNFMREINKLLNENKISKLKADEVLSCMLEFDNVLGLRMDKLVNELEKLNADLPEDVKKLIEEREKARKEKNFSVADMLREKIKQKGYWIDDTEYGPIVRKLEQQNE